MEDSLVNEILQDIKNDNIKSKEELEQEIKYNLYEIYQPYLTFESNKDNFKESFEKLEGYKYVTISQLEEGRFIRFINPKYFYDIKLQKGGFISQINRKKKIITLINGSDITKIYYPKLKIFMKLNESDRVKQQILHAVFN